MTGKLSAVDAMERLGRLGFTVSVCCGPSGAAAFSWSVNVLSPAGEEFPQPFAALSFEHALAIAGEEILKRGWAPRMPPNRVVEHP